MENEIKSKSEVRMKLRQECEACIKKAAGDAATAEECESLLDTADKVQ